jgi:hypothetical protein
MKKPTPSALLQSGKFQRSNQRLAKELQFSHCTRFVDRLLVLDKFFSSKAVILI